MKRTRHRAVTLTALLAAVLGVSGCTSGSSGSPFDGEQNDDDVLPASVIEISTESLDTTTSRLVGEYDGDRFFAVKADADSGDDLVCVAFAPEAKDPTVVCSDELPVGGEVDGLEFELVGVTASDGDGWTAVSDYVRVR